MATKKRKPTAARKTRAKRRVTNLAGTLINEKSTDEQALSALIDIADSLLHLPELEDRAALIARAVAAAVPALENGALMLARIAQAQEQQLEVSRRLLEISENMEKSRMRNMEEARARIEAIQKRADEMKGPPPTRESMAGAQLLRGE